MTIKGHALARRHSSPLTSDRRRGAQRAATSERPAVGGAQRPADLLRLQSTIGNRAVGRLLARQPAARQIQRRVTAHTEEDAEITYRHPDDTNPSGLKLAVKRPKQVVGIIESGKRGPTPDPLVVTSLGAAYQAQRPAIKKAAVVAAVMTYGTYDRGHLMAAEMGGEDKEWNIVPQWSLNQQSGEWRGLEREAAKKKGAELVVTPRYSASAGLWQKVGVPDDIDYKVNDIKSKRSLSSTTWDNAPNQNDLLAPSEMDMTLEIMQSIRAFVEKSGTVDVSSILSSSEVDKDTQESLDDFIQYRNEHGSAKKKKKLSDKTARGKKKAQILKQMVIQGELEAPSSVSHKTPVTEVRKLKGIKVSGSSLFDESDEAETDAEIELSDHDSDEDIDLPPTSSSSLLSRPPKHRPLSVSGSGSSTSRPLYPPTLPPYSPVPMSSRPLSTQTGSGRPSPTQPRQFTSTPKSGPTLYPPVVLSSAPKPHTPQIGSGSAPPMHFTPSAPPKSSTGPKPLPSSGKPLLVPPLSSTGPLPKTTSTSGLSSQKPGTQMDVEPSTASSSGFVAQQPISLLPLTPSRGSIYAVGSSYFYDGSALGGLLHGQITDGVVVATGEVKSGYFGATVREGTCVWGVSFTDPKGKLFDPKGKTIWFPLASWPHLFEWRGFTFD